MRFIESYIVISPHQLDSSPVYENVSDLQVVAAADRRHRGTGGRGVKSSQVYRQNLPCNTIMMIWLINALEHILLST